MYKYELNTLLEKVLGTSYQMKNGESAYHCPFCNHHKKKLQVNFETQKWHCWVCNKGGHKIGILLRKINAPKNIISEVLKILGDYKGTRHEKEEVQNMMLVYHNVMYHFGKKLMIHYIKMPYII